MYMNNETTEILNEIEQSKIQGFVEDTILFEAVKKYLLYYLYQEGVITKGQPHKGNVNWALALAFNANAPAQLGGIPRTNEELGADIRAKAQAVQVIESGFKELADMKKVEKEVEEEIKHV